VKASRSTLGSLDRRDGLERLVEGTDVVVHCAGLTKARTDAEFRTVNVEGTARLAEVAAACARRPRFLLLSSLAAREPEISPYAASKRGAENALARHGKALEHCSLRPPGIYGPGDRATLPLFRQLAQGMLFVPRVPGARLSLLYVQDLVAIVDRLLAKDGWAGRIMEVDDGRSGGYGWSDLADAASRHLGRRVRLVSVPHWLLWTPAQLNQWFARACGRATFFTPDKLREFFHPNWVAEPVPGGGPLDGWRAGFTFDTGFPATLEWYRAEGWL